MRTDQKEYQMLAEAYATIQEREQVDEMLGFGTGGMGDKFLRQLPTLAPNKAGKADARIQTAEFIKQRVMPKFNTVIQGKKEGDLVDVGQVMDVVGNAYQVDPDQIPTFQKYQPGSQMKVADARKLIFPAATDAAAVEASERYAAGNNRQGGYTPMQGGGQAGGGQAAAGGGQAAAGGGQASGGIKAPRGTEAQPVPSDPTFAQKLGSGVGKFFKGAVAGAAGTTGAAKGAFDRTKNFVAGGQEQQNGQEQQDSQEQQNGQERADPEGLPSMEDLAKGNQAEVVEPEVIDNGGEGENTQSLGMPGDGDKTQETSVDMQQNQSQGNEINPTVITPPPPKTDDQSGISDSLKGFGDAVAAGAEDKISEYVTRIQNGEDVNTVTDGLPPAMKAEVEKRASQSQGENPDQLQLPLKEQYIRPLGGCGFMSKRWGKF